MAVSSLISRSVGLLLIASVLAGAWWWGKQYEESAIITISASHDNFDLGLPVYAQFVFTQSLKMPRLASVSRLEIPLYAPDSSVPFTVRLLAHERVLAAWELAHVADQEGLGILHLQFDHPRLLEGSLEVQFDGSGISHGQKDLAPRVFVETSDSVFASGNYRIAENSKEGDIAMRFIERELRWLRIWKSWQAAPALGLLHLSQFALVLILTGLMPTVLFSLRSPRSGNGVHTSSDTIQ